MELLGRTEIVLAAIGLLIGTNGLTALAQPPGAQMPGTVQSVADNVMTLTNGASFFVTDQTRVTLLTAVAPADLMAGNYVAITAEREMDGALRANIVSVFPELVRPAEIQREMADIQWCEPWCMPQALMTNATIDDARIDTVAGDELTISVLGETGQVRLAPETRIEIQSIGSMDSIVPGATVTGFVNPSGAATTVYLYVN